MFVFRTGAADESEEGLVGAEMCRDNRTLANGNASRNFSMQKVRILCDVVTCDNAVNVELSKVLTCWGSLSCPLSASYSADHPPRYCVGLPCGYNYHSGQ